jgi:phosphatidate phosphatase LPIN
MAIADIALPDLSPPSPTLSARSDSSKLSGVGVLSKIASIGRRSSRQPLLPTSTADLSSRPSSPLIGPASTPGDLSEDEDYPEHSRHSSMPGSFEDKGKFFPDEFVARAERQDLEAGQAEQEQASEDGFDDGAIFDDDILATGEMRNVPF